MKYLSQIDASRAPEKLASRHGSLAARCSARRAISLIEVLISMFVLLFGLMGVAAIFPVGNYYVVEGEKFDLASGIGQNAFEELKARGMLRPEVWMYAGNPPEDEAINPANPAPPYPTSFPLVIQDSQGPNTGAFNVISNTVLPGRVFVVDPLGTATGAVGGLPSLDVFPYFNVNTSQPNVGMPAAWLLPEQRWPVRRISVPAPDSTGALAFDAMPQPVAETIFRLRDDLAVDQPDESDRPSIQRWDTADIDPTTGNNNNTPNDPSDDVLLRRQYKGDYSWLATIVPTTAEGLEALQPINPDFGEISCDVSVVVFRKRDLTPSATSERLIEAELLQGGELVIYSTSNTPKEVVDAAVEDVRPGNWISLMGVNRTTGAFVMKWYRLLSLDDETVSIDLTRVPTSNNITVQGRRAMLIGPDWPTTPNPADPGRPLPVTDLRAGILPGVISVVTKPLKMEDFSLWKLE